MGGGVGEHPVEVAFPLGVVGALTGKRTQRRDGHACIARALHHHLECSEVIGFPQVDAGGTTARSISTYMLRVSSARSPAVQAFESTGAAAGVGRCRRCGITSEAKSCIV